MTQPPPMTRPRQSWWLLPVHVIAVLLGSLRLWQGATVVGVLLLTFGTLGVVSWVVSRLAAAKARRAAAFEIVGGSEAVVDEIALRLGPSLNTELVGTKDGQSRYYLVTTTTLSEAELPDVEGAWHVRAEAGEDLMQRHLDALAGAHEAFPELSPRRIEDADAMRQRVLALRARRVGEVPPDG